MTEIEMLSKTIDDLNQEAIDDSEQDTSVTLAPFTFTSDGTEWHVEYLGHPCTSSEELDRSEIQPESIREHILDEARKYQEVIKKYLLRTKPREQGGKTKRLHFDARLRATIDVQGEFTLEDIVTELVVRDRGNDNFVLVHHEMVDAGMEPDAL